MNITVLTKLVPDLVEELTIDEQSATLDTTWLRFKLNEFDDHAIEQAILLKGQSRELGEPITVMILVPDIEGADDVLFTAAAKLYSLTLESTQGNNRLTKLSGDFEQGVNNHALARAFAAELQTTRPDLILTGVQAHNDLDGALGPLVAGCLNLPYVGYVSKVTIENGCTTVRKEYPGGLVAEMEVTLPAVLGIQAAAQPLSYVAFSKIRQAMKSTSIDEIAPQEFDLSGGPLIKRMYKPESSQHATLIMGNADEIAGRLVEILQEKGVL